jgi:hypothetical protein
MWKKICMERTRDAPNAENPEKKNRSHPWKVAVNSARGHGGAEHTHDTYQ